MPSFFLAFIAALVTSIGSRDQLLISQLSRRLGRSYVLLFTGWLVAIVTACIMAWAGQAAAQILPPEGKAMLVAIAMVLAGVELAWPNRVVAAKEPTRSLGAIALVLFSRQLCDAGRFLIFAIASATGSPVLAAIGGALGGGGAVTIGWLMAQSLEVERPLSPVRLLLAGIILLLGMLIGLSARGLID